MKRSVSAIIIVKNEENNIRACLDSVKWVDEIVVIDSGSTDSTEDVCREYTDKYFFMEWQGFGVQKQRALDRATSEWVLSIDADERVGEGLKDEIIGVLDTDKNIEASGFFVPRRSTYLGRKIRYCGWYPDYVLRLAAREQASFTNDYVHEKLEVGGDVGKLQNDLFHFPYKNMGHNYRKINDYSDIAAREMFKSGKTVTWPMVFLRSFFAFIRVLILKRGILDGWQGVALSLTSSVHVFLKYVKLMELNMNRK